MSVDIIMKSRRSKGVGRHGQACAGPFIQWNQGPRLFPLPSRWRVLSQHAGPGLERLEASEEEGVEAGKGETRNTSQHRPSHEKKGFG